MKTLRNIIILLVAAFLVVLVLRKVKDHTTVPPVENGDDDIVVAEEMKFTSLKGVEIFVMAPQTGDVIMSPLEIYGRAPGNWFFEANAGVVLTDWDGLIIAEHYMMAEGEWMTTDYVPFRGTLTFTKPVCMAEHCKRGALILRKDNPSGLPEHDDAVEIPIKFE